ncbi:MerR family transcriptional regulator [Roseospira visakhapatnamensis]|uniref:DNA-binding transcriptional MerR regulator n=1 Tax=Roseospira visakhapatnamensis TaxID=390880 RepID=A0A7W6RAI0_9PROT|nr:MerR family DNA-binding transcriptional regulator [Roseospira visakhapatnamensis]MBB4264541.1 DNA-binding transcriptional MerR regulator [Roseospira visakhapatnamensis]
MTEPHVPPRPGPGASLSRDADGTDITYSIADLAREFEITPRAIRFYEDKGLLEPRREGLRRVYSERERVRLLLIVRGKRLGFSLRECQDIIDMYGAEPTEGAQLQRLIETIRQRRSVLQDRLADLRLTLKELDEVEAQAQRLLDATGEDTGEASAPGEPAGRPPEP